MQLTPREIVEALDKYIIGQDRAKRAVAVALRNRYRRSCLPDELRVEAGLSPDTMRLLEGLGHQVVVREAMGDAQSLLRAPEGWYGFSDTRQPGGLAAGY